MEDKQEPEYGELCGGPYDGLLCLTLGLWLVSYSFYIYCRTTRLSLKGQDIYCYDHLGHLSTDPELEALLRKSWE